MYDYSGGSIAKYELDATLTTFTVDEQSRTIYGYSGEVFEGVFFNIPFSMGMGITFSLNLKEM